MLLSLFLNLQGTNRHPLEFNCPPSREVDSFTLVLVYKRDYFVGFVSNRKKKKKKEPRESLLNGMY